MNKLKSKLKSKKGFTLIEMLIVVAIIAILVAIAVPVVNSSLEKARTETDNANMRAAKIAAVSDYFSTDKTGSVTYYFNADGSVSTGTKPTSGNEGYNYGKASGHEGKYVQVEVDATGKANATWQ